jgi:uncharacterized membrane protein YraQ (UPF0718 family)
MWFLNPIKSIRYIIWHNYKWTIIKVLCWIALVVFLGSILQNYISAETFRMNCHPHFVKKNYPRPT